MCNRFRWLKGSGKWVLFSLGLLWLILLGVAERRLEGNHLWLLGATYDAGQVLAGRPIEHTVWVFNPTLKGFYLRREASCGCTVADLPATLSPLSGFQMRVKVDTEGLKAGAYTQRVWMIVQDKEQSWREEVRVQFTVVERSAQQR